jgi:hypothetical protein
MKKKVKCEATDMTLLRSGLCRTCRDRITNEILGEASVVRNLLGHAKGSIQREYREKH